MLILNEVLITDFSSILFSLYSAVYFIIPLLIAAFDNENNMEQTFANCPTSATPEGPNMAETNFVATNPEMILMKVDIAEKNVVLNNFITHFLFC